MEWQNFSILITGGTGSFGKKFVELYCHSVDKEKKEESIKNKFQERFEAELLKADKALNVKNGTKRYDKVVEKIGRLKEKFKRISHLYNAGRNENPGCVLSPKKCIVVIIR